MEYQMPVRAIKNILMQELQGFFDAFYREYPGSFVMSDVQKEMVRIAKEVLSAKLEFCNTYEELNAYISDAGYRMSLEEWINSL